MLAPTVAHLGFARADGQAFQFVPGQFLQAHFHYGDGTATKRSYSLAGPAGTIEIAVSYVAGGAATALFEGLDIGDQLDASGPYGRFCLLPDDDNRRYLLVATGTGVTPYRAMLPRIEALIAERGIHVVLLQGARSPVELLYGDEFRAFADTHPENFRYVPCLSRELPAQPHPDVRNGYVQQFLGQFGPDRESDIAYLCGNPNMVDACFEALKEAGLDVRRIRREKYVSSK
ncbi:MAG: FAD-binding oxidoreductase [Pseudomonadota bacterium]|nr:FAD-binding oxidoreductase [Pseudomonadota bacterium]